VAARPVSRIRRAALQTDNLLFAISRREVSMMSTLAVTAGFASHRRHNFSSSSSPHVGIEFRLARYWGVEPNRFRFTQDACAESQSFGSRGYQ